MMITASKTIMDVGAHARRIHTNRVNTNTNPLHRKSEVKRALRSTKREGVRESRRIGRDESTPAGRECE